MKKVFFKVPETDKQLWVDMALYGIVTYTVMLVLPFESEFLAQFGGRWNLALFQAFGYGLALQSLRIFRDIQKR